VNAMSFKRKIHKLQEERENLVRDAQRFIVFLDEPTTSSAVIQDSIEELRAIRMMIHAIDNQIVEYSQMDVPPRG
jgi:hypothetical protein